MFKPFIIIITVFFTLALLVFPSEKTTAQSVQECVSPSVVVEQMTLYGAAQNMRIHAHLKGNDARSFRLAIAGHIGQPLEQMVNFDEVITVFVLGSSNVISEVGLILFNENCYVQHTIIPLGVYIALMRQQAVEIEIPNAS
jgi:hypothetical protein